jgi:flavodoxin
VNILIAYYSHTGATRRAAQALQAASGGDLYEIRVRNTYSRVYNEVLKRGRQEINAGIQPPLAGELPDLGKYDLLLIGSPNWCSTIAPPVSSFLAALDTAGKRIVPFLTHGGGGLGHAAADIRKLCPNASVGETFDANDTDRVPAFIQSLTNA